MFDTKINLICIGDAATYPAFGPNNHSFACVYVGAIHSKVNDMSFFATGMSIYNLKGLVSLQGMLI